MICLVIFAAATAFIWVIGRRRGVLSEMLGIMGLAIQCLITGVRDEIVGADVLSYAKWMCTDARVLGLPDFVQTESDPMTSDRNLFSRVVVRLMGGLLGYLFCIEAICIVSVNLGLWRASRDYEWIGMLLCLLLEFTFILNGMRQAVATGFVFYAINYITERKQLRLVLWVAMGMLFHQTPAIGLLLYLPARMGAVGSGFKRFFGCWSGRALTRVNAVCAGATFALGPHIVVLTPVLKDSNRYQVSYLGENDFSIYGAYLRVGLLLIWVPMRREFTDDKVDACGVALCERFSVVCLLSALGCFAWRLNLVSVTLDRTGYYGTGLIPPLGDIRSQCIPLAGSMMAAIDFPSRLLCSDDIRAGQVECLAVHDPDAWDCLAWRWELSTCPWVGFIDINHTAASTGGC
jgi:hypothetical protein